MGLGGEVDLDGMEGGAAVRHLPADAGNGDAAVDDLSSSMRDVHLMDALSHASLWAHLRRQPFFLCLGCCPPGADERLPAPSDSAAEDVGR